MTEILVDDLILQKNEVLENIKQIEETCEGIENESNAQRVSELNMKQVKLSAEKNSLNDKLLSLEQELNRISEEIRNLSGIGIDRILKDIKNQRWFFFKNKPNVLMDRDTGILWANLDYFKYRKNKKEYYSLLEAKQIVSKLEIHEYNNWQIPTKSELIKITNNKNSPFKKRCNNQIDEFYMDNDEKRDEHTIFGSINYEKKLLLPCCKSLTYNNYEKNISRNNKIYTETEKLQFTLNIFVDNRLEPVFNDDEITQLYKKIYVEKPKLVQKLNELEEQIEELQQVVLLSSNFDYNSLLLKYNVEAIDNSIIKYYEAIQCWINNLMDKLDYFEEVKEHIIRDFNIISLKLSRKYENNHNLKDQENVLLKNRQQFFKKHFELGMNGVKNKLLSIKKQSDNIENRINEINEGDNSIKELAILENEERASFKFIAENTATIIKNALLKIEYFEENRIFATNIINLEDKWTENYKVFKTTMKDEFKNTCEEDSIEEELWLQWYNDWTKKRYIIEMCFLPLIERGLKGAFAINKIQISNTNKNSEVTVVEKLIDLLEDHKANLDKFYLEERKNIYQKFAFQVGGDLQEKFETESELYRITSLFQKYLQEIIFSLDKAEDRIFLLKWANNLLDIQVDEILDFVKDKELSKISQDVLIEFADLKTKNYESFISDAKAYSKERTNREKQYNSLVFKMRKELMK